MTHWSSSRAVGWPALAFRPLRARFAKVSCQNPGVGHQGPCGCGDSANRGRRASDDVRFPRRGVSLASSEGEAPESSSGHRAGGVERRANEGAGHRRSDDVRRGPGTGHRRGRSALHLERRRSSRIVIGVIGGRTMSGEGRHRTSQGAVCSSPRAKARSSRIVIGASGRRRGAPGKRGSWTSAVGRCPARARHRASLDAVCSSPRAKAKLPNRHRGHRGHRRSDDVRRGPGTGHRRGRSALHRGRRREAPEVSSGHRAGGVERRANEGAGHRRSDDVRRGPVTGHRRGRSTLRRGRRREAPESSSGSSGWRRRGAPRGVRSWWTTDRGPWAADRWAHS